MGLSLVSAQTVRKLVHVFVPDYITMDITKHAREVVEIVELAASLDEKLTPLKVCDTWMGKGSSKIRKMSKVTTLSRLEVESIIVHLLLHGYFRYCSMSLT